jgi:antitoxin component of MazEF toxin-antitoxin module
MGVRKQSEQNIRKITKLGNKSLAVTLPIQMMGELKWKDGQKVVVKRTRGGLLIKDWKK